VDVKEIGCEGVAWVEHRAQRWAVSVKFPVHAVVTEIYNRSLQDLDRISGHLQQFAVTTIFAHPTPTSPASHLALTVPLA
jgi:hypothetical protein